MADKQKINSKEYGHNIGHNSKDIPGINVIQVLLRTLDKGGELKLTIKDTQYLYICSNRLTDKARNVQSQK